MTLSVGDVVWSPPADVRERTELGRYLGWLERERGRSFAGYGDLFDWSVTDLEGFWGSLWDFFGLQASTRATSRRTPTPA